MTATTTGSTVAASRQSKVERLMDTIDRGDVEGLVAHFAADGIQQMGNQAPMQGHNAIRAGNSGFLGSLAGLKHEITGLWESAGTVIVRLIVHYELRDGRRISLPAMTVFDEDAAGLIRHYQVWFDAAPLFASP